MYKLNSLKEISFERKGKKRLGRGRGSKLGKTSGRGHKGMGARSGSNLKLGHEGGRKPMHLTLPVIRRSRRAWKDSLDIINLIQIFAFYNSHQEINMTLLVDKGFLATSSIGFKVLGNTLEKYDVGDIKLIKANCFSESAKKVLASHNIVVESV